MATKSTTQKKLQKNSRKQYESTIPLSGAERVRLLQQIRGMWRDRQPDPHRELKKIRNSWERRTPSKK
jgi:hypothetical protein